MVATQSELKSAFERAGIKKWYFDEVSGGACDLSMQSVCFVAFSELERFKQLPERIRCSARLLGPSIEDLCRLNPSIQADVLDVHSAFQRVLGTITNPVMHAKVQQQKERILVCLHGSIIYHLGIALQSLHLKASYENGIYCLQGRNFEPM